MIHRIVLLFSIIYFSNNWAKAQFTLVGDATASADLTCFTITPDLNLQSGAIWYERQADISASFDIYVQALFGSRDAGADGLAFVLQQVSTNEGAEGEGIGYGGISPSLAIEFDTHPNESNNDPQFDHIGIMANGDPNHLMPGNLVTPVNILASGNNAEDGNLHDIRISWDAESQTISVYVDCDLRTSYTGDIVNDIFGGDGEVFWGFTSATGNRTNKHSVCLQYVSFLDELNDTTICEGEFVQLDAGSGGGITFSWAPVTGLDDPNIHNPIATPTQTTTYVVTITDNCGNDRTDSVTITVSQPFNTDAGPDEAICIGNGVQLQASGGDTYSWSPAIGLSNPNIANPIASPTATTIYTLTASDSIGCSLTDEVTVTVNPLPLAAASATTTEVCEGSSVTLTASGGTSYNWFPTTGLSSPTTAVTEASPTTTVVYQVEVADNNGCLDTAKVSLLVNPLPNISAGADLNLCEGESGILDGSGGNNYSWSPVDGLSDPNVANPLAAPNATTTYTLTSVDINGCEAQDEVTVSVATKPVADGLAFAEVCEGEGTQLLVSGGNSYRWSTGETTAGIDISPPASQDFWVIPEQNGCVGDTFFISVNVLESPKILVPPTTYSGLAPLEINFPLASRLASEFNWDFGDGSTSDIASPTHIYDTPGTYTVSVDVRSPFGCEASAVVAVVEVASPIYTVPNAFTPNDDGYNDTFSLNFLSADQFHIWIYNRWGRLVYESQDPDQAWDGTKDGKPVATGVYTYIMEVAPSATTQATRRSGTITLIR